MKKPTAGIILAAGESTRFGEPKQLVAVAGGLLIGWPLAAALESKLDHVVLVLGCEHDRIRRCLGSASAHPKCEVIVNPDYRSGQSASLKAGVLRIRNDFPSVMFLLGDQPLVDTAVIDLLLERFVASEKPICVPTHRGSRGNPVLFASCFYPQLLAIEGDLGARDIIDGHSHQVLAVEIDDPRVFLDVDRREDAETATALLKPRSIRPAVTVRRP